jgi:hypothetical protein
MAVDINAELRATNKRIDELRELMDERFEKIENRRRSEQDRAFVLLVIAMTLVLIYALARGFKWL